MYIVVDMGGTNMRLARSEDLTHFDDPVIFPTSLAYDEGVAALIGTIEKVSHGDPVHAIAAGIPFVLSRDKRTIINSTNLPDWVGKDLVRDLESHFNTRVYLENDAAMVGLGEATFGAGRGRQIVVYITISTGVNGARILEGRIDVSTCGFEIGWQYITFKPELIKWSKFISGRSISQKYGKHPKELGKDNPLWEELARMAAIGVHNSILHWSPDCVVIGGSMVNEIGIPVDRIRYHVADIMKIFPTIPDIVHSELKDVGGLWGGLARLKQEG